jgi:hypothetical protein
MLLRDEARILALLGAAYGRQMSPRIMHHVARASEQWVRGETALAQFELAFARLPRLQTREEAFRLFLAEEVLAQGMSPHELTKALGFDPALLKYDADQPREPAGNGRNSGRWVRVDISGAQAEASAASGTLAGAASLLEDITPAVTRWLGSFAAETTGAAGLGPASAIIFAGFLVFPISETGGVKEGDVPTLPGVSYRFSESTRELEITARADDGATVSLHARRRDDSGVYDDAKGRPLGRDVGAGL